MHSYVQISYHIFTGELYVQKIDCGLSFVLTFAGKKKYLTYAEVHFVWVVMVLTSVKPQFTRYSRQKQRRNNSLK